MPSSLGYDWAAYEVKYQSQPPPNAGRAYFGTDNNHAASASYGLHTYIRASNQWLTWTAATFPGTECHYSGAIHHSLAQWYSFWADDYASQCE